MSADRWSICPKCQEAHTKAKVDAAVKLREAYGKVPVEEYLAMKQAVENPPELGETLREDYEFWLNRDTRMLNISYSASCQECSFEIRHENSQPYKL